MGKSVTIPVEGVPDLAALMLLTLEALRKMGGSGTLHEIDEVAAEVDGVTEAEQQIPVGTDTRPKFIYFMAWARTYLKKAGALDNSQRGVWTLTALGEQTTTHLQCNQLRKKVQAERKKTQEEQVEQTDTLASDLPKWEYSNLKRVFILTGAPYSSRPSQRCHRTHSSDWRNDRCERLAFFG